MSAPAGSAAVEPSAASDLQNLQTLAVLGLLLAFGLGRALWLAWLCDDAFISLRYAENLVNGHGLVYNPGEYVEGYSNLLWTLLLAAFLRAGVDLVFAAKYLGMLAYAALALCLAHWSWRRSRDTRRPFLPLAAGLVLVSDDFNAWASGGLETMLFTYLAVQALLLTRWEGASSGRPLAAGLLFSLLVLTRPDGLLFAGAGALSYWLPPHRFPRRLRIRASLAILGPVSLVLAAWIPFKLSYYGELFPTPFFAKSVMRPYLSQGLVYLGLYLLKNWFLPVALVAAALGRTPTRSRSDRWDSLFFLGAAGIFLAYLLYVGGDFMFARRILPSVPLLFLVLENHLVRFADESLRTRLAIAALMAAVVTIPVHTPTRPRIRGVSEERFFYPAEVIERRRAQAEAVGSALAGTGARVAFEGGMCVFGYYSKLPYLVEMTGLTQYSLAKLPLAERGLIGHEKSPTEEWLRDNDIHMVIRHEVALEAPFGKPRSADEIVFSGIVRATIKAYSDDVMDAIRNRAGVSFVPIEEVIEHAKREMRSRSLDDAERIYERLHRYYFRQAGERGRAAAAEIEALLEKKRAHGSSRSTNS